MRSCGAVFVAAAIPSPKVIRHCEGGFLKSRELAAAAGDDAAIAAHLGLATDDFIERFTRITPDRQALSLTETEAGACIFLEEEPPTCRIEAVKPRQCRDFPEHWNFPGWEEACEGGREEKR